jgi:hypothetical protein
MRITNIFSVGIGIEQVPEMLPLARKIFTENKDIFKSAGYHTGLRTTLSSYFKDIEVCHTKNEDTELLERFILLQATNYIGFCGYKAKNYSYTITMWLNEMERNSVHKLHHHYGHNISGCYYVDLPKDSNTILFSHTHLNSNSLGLLEVNEYTPFNSASWKFAPKEGELYLWKSDMYHEVPQLDFNGVRRSIGFDVSVVDKVEKK